LLGIQRFLYKVSAEKKCNSAWTTFSFMATVSLLSSVLFILSDEPVSGLTFLLFISIVNSGSFVLSAVSHMEALKRMPAGVVYPIIRLNVVVVVLFSIAFFKDRLSLFQAFGIAMAVVSMHILTKSSLEPNSISSRAKHGFLFTLVALICGSIASISSKFAAMHTDKLAFMAISYLFGTLVSFTLAKNQTVAGTDGNLKDALIIGFVMGLINFAGFYSFLKALSSGPLSIIVSITGLHFIIAIILSSLIYKERLTSLRVLGISTTILSILFLRVV